MNEVGGPPDPGHAATAAEYVAALARLRHWSGLTYRQLAARADGSLPASTTSSVLGRATLPRESFVTAFAAACGLDEAEIDRWVRVRRSLAMSTVDEPVSVAQEPEPCAGTLAEAGPGPVAEVSPPETSRRPAWSAVRRGWPTLVTAAGMTAVLLAAPTVLADMSETLEGRPSADHLSSRALPQDGWYRMRPSYAVDRELCVGEGRERSRRTDRPLAVQRSCAGVAPDTYLKALGAGVYEIQWHHPEEGVGCLTVDQAHLGEEALLAPADCTAAAHQRFLLEPERAGRGYALRPVHSGKCLGLLYGEADVHPGAELAQHTCSGKRDQIFRFETADRPDWLETEPVP
ncbi:XRE family transcriptional regulator [Planomonospora sp. ID91781]|uniref:XRE family transcriptional regulator n=1 Tax=Planomonospora sp. ID91781 TaxID=2738135 RepID=UPI0018C3CA26|nr:XRE family transcriptional regulator [Planomonospora sp. ID91781]MBG0822253.1 XRE family transcriptional regulator [Planomonospora sp. ID91781]